MLDGLASPSGKDVAVQRRTKIAQSFPLALVAIMALAAVNCSGGDILVAVATLTPIAVSTAHAPLATSTSTPTSVIVAVERTPSPVRQSASAIWQGTITSNTSRTYLSNGSEVMACSTDWVTDLTFVVDPTGGVSGHAEGALMPPRQCNVTKNLVPNLTAYKFAVSGQKTQSGFDLGLQMLSFSPGPPAGESGGYILLIAKGPCPGVPHTFQVPMTSAKTAEATLNYSDATLGCGGSKDDIFKSDNLVKLNFFAECSQRPTDLNDPQIDKLCQ
jgi:hypothetical protein